MSDRVIRPIDKVSAITRTTSPFMEEILGWAFPVLDHGFIRVIDYMGDDHAIDEAARISYGAGTKRKNEARGLINYLMSHKHSSPFEMCEIKLHVKLPIFVMRQWVRHRMASLNEYSARYSVLSNEFYLPPLDELKHQSLTNKQGRAETIDEPLATRIRNNMHDHAFESYDFYQMLLSDEVDLSRELARINLPVSFYTEMYWKIDLHNLFHFLLLRGDSHAQKEIQDYTFIIDDIVKRWVPYAHDAFKVYRRDAISFSGHEALLIRAALASYEHLNPDEKPVYADKLSKREWKEFVNKIKRIA